MAPHASRTSRIACHSSPPIRTAATIWLTSEAQHVARLSQLDAFERRYRLMLDAHRLLALDEEHPEHN